MYKILCSAMGYDGGKSGISEYINEVVRALSEGHKIDLIILKKDRAAFPLQESNNLTFIEYPDSLAKPFVNMLWHLYILPLKLDFKKYDFIFLPAGNRRLFSRYPIPSLITFLDLSQFHVDAKYDELRMAYIKKVIPHYLKRVDKVLAISENTRQDIIKFYKYPQDKIVVNHLASNTDLFSPLNETGREFRYLPKKKKYILYVARIEHPGKNHLNLIKAYETLPENIKNEYNLVFAGSDWSRAEEVHSYVEKSSDKTNIAFTGYVAKEVLPVLYREASLYAFPSYYEGFGIPMLEAMSSAVPLVCSNTSCLPEIGGDAALLFNPEDSKDIANAIQNVLENRELRQDLIAKGLKRVQLFDWARHARKIIEEYEKMAHK